VGKDGSAVHGMKSVGLRRTLTIGPAVVLGTLAALAFITALQRPGPEYAGNAALPRERLLDHRVPEPVAPAFAAADPIPIRPDKRDSVWAIVERPTAVHKRPTAHSRAVGRLATVTPEGTDNIVLILDRQTDLRGRVWVRVRFPSLPNGRTGWISRKAIGGYGTVHTRMVIDLSDLRAQLYQRGQMVFEAPVGVGKPSWPTPPGRFYIRNRLTRFGNPFYGPVAFGTSARSQRLTDWPAGGFVGIHGTNRPELIPGRVSHGCVRMRNHDIRRLDRLMRVGTPVVILP